MQRIPHDHHSEIITALTAIAIAIIGLFKGRRWRKEQKEKRKK